MIAPEPVLHEARGAVTRKEGSKTEYYCFLRAEWGALV
jgi:hypothetical protein